MKKLFINPEINTVQLGAEEPIMTGIASMLVQKGANGVINYSVKDKEREESDRQSYWSGK